MAIVKRAAGSLRAREVAAADHHARRVDVAGAPSRDDRREVRAPRPSAADMPAVSGVSDQPSSANQPGARMRYQRTADGRMPPNAGRATSGQRTSVESSRLRGSIKREIAAAPDRRGTTPAPALPVFQNFAELQPLEPRRRRQLGANADVFRFERPHERLVHRQRRRVATFAPRLSSPPARERRALLARRRRRAPDSRSPPPAIEMAAAATGTAANRHERNASDRQEGDHRHERQRVADERRVLKQQVEDQVRDAQRHDRREAAPIAPAAAARPPRRRGRGRRSRAPWNPRDRRTCASARTRPRAGSDWYTASRRRRNLPPPACRARRDRRSGRRWPRAAECPRPGRRSTNIVVLPISAPATPRPIRSNRTTTSSGNVSHIVCERTPIARPARNAPSHDHPPRRSATHPATGDDRRRHRDAGATTRAAGTPAPPAQTPVLADRSSAAPRGTKQRTASP